MLKIDKVLQNKFIAFFVFNISKDQKVIMRTEATHLGSLFFKYYLHKSNEWCIWHGYMDADNCISIGKSERECIRLLKAKVPYLMKVPKSNKIYRRYCPGKMFVLPLPL